MTFSTEQTEALQAPLSKAHVKERTQAGRQLSYIEAWWAIAEANRIFGFDAWDRTTVELRQLGEPREVEGKWRVAYMARVRIVVTTRENQLAGYSADTISREGCGFGSGIDRDVGQAHESALKEAESDAMKRALMTFGNPFGLALYDKTQANVVAEPQSAPRDAPNGRLTAALAKRQGEDAKIKTSVSGCTLAGLLEWETHFDAWTAHLPYSWLDSIRDMIELRREELLRPAAAEDMDDAFRATIGHAA